MPAPARTPEGVVNELLRRAIPNGDCLECHLRPSIDKRGRERHFISVGGREGVKWRASRLVYQIKKGPIPDYRIIRHTCDNMKCINPDHLIIGTYADNTEDMMSRGRGAYKIRTPKLGDRIRNLKAKGMNRFEIAAKLMVSPNTVWNYLSEQGPYYGK